MERLRGASLIDLESIRKVKTTYWGLWSCLGGVLMHYSRPVSVVCM